MKRELRVAAVQCKTLPLEMRGLNIDKMTRIVERIGKKKDLIVFPELSATGYGGDPVTLSFKKRLWEQAEEVPGSLTRTFEKVARKTGCHVAYGTAERSESRYNVHNAAVLVGPEGYVGHIRKTHLTGEDDAPFEAGNEIKVFHTDLGMIGLMVCYDMWFPEVGRLLALKGADLITILSSAFAGGKGGGIGSRRSKKAMWDILPSSIALNNLVHVIACNGAGAIFLGKRLGYWERLGRTRIIDALGNIVGETNSNHEAIVTGTLTRTTLEQARKQYSLLRDRVPRLYKPLIE